MGTLLQDLRYGARMLWKNPGLTFIAVVALALGIGANTAIFSVVNAVLLRPLPFGDPERLVMLWGSAPQNQLGWDALPVTGADFVDWRDQNKSFQQVAAFRTWAWHLTGGDNPEQVWGAKVSGSFFSTLGVKPLMGRTFSAEEDQPGAGKTIVMGYGLWQRRFGADPDIVGKTIMLTGQSYTVLGVMPQGFKFPGGANMLSGFRFSPQTEMWEPLAMTADEQKNRFTGNLAVIGRLKPDATIKQAQSEMSAIAHRLEQQYPSSNAGLDVKLVSLHEQVVGNVRPALLILLVTVGFVLLIACANVANLLLARAAARQKEVAIRTALGAGRGRLIRQFLTESMLLSLCGGATGLLLAMWGIDALSALIPDNIPRAAEITVDARMLGFTLLVSLLTGLVFGLAPALQSSKTDVNESLKDGARGASHGLARNRMRSLLVVSEVALTLVLLIGAGLLIRSFMRLQRVNPGFDPANVTTMDVVLPFLPPSKYMEDERKVAFYSQLLERVRQIPGVEQAGAVESLPLSGAIESTSFSIEGRAASPPSQQPQADYTEITPQYFQTMAMPLKRGRDFTEQDKADAPGVVVINETMAHLFWPNEDPIGKRIKEGGAEANPYWNPPWMTIVGVVGDVKQLSLNNVTTPAMYVPHAQKGSALMTLVVRSKAEPASLAAAIQREVHQLDADIPVTGVKTMDQVLAASVSQRRFSMFLLGIFAVVALVLATVGIYGVMSYSVTQRTHEIGIRLALGAQSSDVLKLILKQGMMLTLTGLALGLLAAFFMTKLMSSLLYGVSATDPATFAGISLLLFCVSLVACYIPARKALKVDPNVALRYE